MGKFRIRLKLQGLELEVDGDREDIPAITTAVSNQLTGMIIPAENFADGRKQLIDGANNGAGVSGDDDKKKDRRGRRGGSRGSGEPAAAAIEYKHDGVKYGNPVQGWTLEEKCIWLLYILKKIANINEVSGPQLAATFNQYFKPAGKIHPPHVTIKLGKKKLENPPPIGEDKGNYYLTDEGEKQADQLIKDLSATK
jgi:hypothetical protein